MNKTHFDQLERTAREFATSAHWGQMYGSLPYLHHLKRVAEIADLFHLPYHVRIAAWLHDVIEDTPVTFNNVLFEFGIEVACLVFAVTDEESDYSVEKLMSEDHITSEEEAKRIVKMDMKERTYPKMLSNPYGVHLKLCDRISNVEACIVAKKDNKFQKYKAQHKAFTDALYYKGDETLEAMWAKLNSLMRGEV